MGCRTPTGSQESRKLHDYQRLAVCCRWFVKRAPGPLRTHLGGLKRPWLRGPCLALGRQSRQASAFPGRSLGTRNENENCIATRPRADAGDEGDDISSRGTIFVSVRLRPRPPRARGDLVQSPPAGCCLPKIRGRPMGEDELRQLLELVPDAMLLVRRTARSRSPTSRRRSCSATRPTNWPACPSKDSCRSDFATGMRNTARRISPLPSCARWAATWNSSRSARTATKSPWISA